MGGTSLDSRVKSVIRCLYFGVKRTREPGRTAMTLLHPSTRFVAWLAGAPVALAAPAYALVIAQTSFETELAVPGAYTDTGDPAEDHDLTNHAAEPLVEATPASAAGGGGGGRARAR